MKQYVYSGPEVNLGRFGVVKNGEILTLTASEEAMILRDGDKRFKEATAKTKAPALVVVPPAQEGETPEQKEAREKAEAEKARQENIALANSQSRKVELESMSKAALREEIEARNLKGAKIKAHDAATKGELIRLIRENDGEKLGAEQGEEVDEKTGQE